MTFVVNHLRSKKHKRLPKQYINYTVLRGVQKMSLSIDRADANQSRRSVIDLSPVQFDNMVPLTYHNRDISTSEMDHRP